MSLAALCLQLEGNLLVLGSLARELNLQIGIDGRRCGSRFGQASAHDDHGKLRAAGDLLHMKVAVAIPGIKRLDGHRDQKIAFSCVTSSLTSRGVAHTISLMQWMGYMVHALPAGKRPRTAEENLAYLYHLLVRSTERAHYREIADLAQERLNCRESETPLRTIGEADIRDMLKRFKKNDPSRYAALNQGAKFGLSVVPSAWRRMPLFVKGKN